MSDSIPDLHWRPSAADPEEYAKVSHDFSGVHLDDSLARAEGLPGVILHGMHVLGHVVSHLDRYAQPGRLTSVTVRFLDVTLPEEGVSVRMKPTDEHNVIFDAMQGDRQVLGEGLASFSKD
ncbi:MULTISPECIES: MaoC/PaaZ C-terminal domain-containing protein [unclassified Aeromicrobium]|uniref:MaoC/PaaZ C-terminal domain-containing protein n=1 Tax=unclassified Aeromicrobium TaxID=2633570 RepID=UPI0028890F85|nr:MULTISPECIES: MaoC/PaaZ C-terminal domain-containing protein [unclassified Aeromicrobium]